MSDEFQRPGYLRIWVRAFRPFAYPASLLPVLVGTFAVTPFGSVHWGLLAVVLIAVFLMHSGGNLLNEYFDFHSGVDIKVRPEAQRFWGALPSGYLKPVQVLIAAFLCLTLAALLGIHIVRSTGVWSLILGIIGALGLYSYTGIPFQFKYRGLGDLVIFLLYGPCITVGSSFVQSGTLGLVPLLLSFPVGMLVVGILVANNIRDYQGDLDAGIRTSVGILGLQQGKRIYVSIVLGSPGILLILALAGLLPTRTLLSLLATPLGFSLARRVFRSQAFLSDLDARTAQYMTLFTGLLILALATAG